jgi:hypothetical protein
MFYMIGNSASLVIVLDTIHMFFFSCIRDLRTVPNVLLVCQAYFGSDIQCGSWTRSWCYSIRKSYIPSQVFIAYKNTFSIAAENKLKIYKTIR